MTDDREASLRPLCSEDAVEVLAAFESHPDMARQGTVTTLAEAEAYVAELTGPESIHRPWAVLMDERVIGLVCVSVDQTNLNGWFWYWMHAQARGAGVMKRAATTVANWALTTGGLERLELGHRLNNPASGAIARAAGFTHEGTERAKFRIAGERIDVDTYGRLSSDPTPQTIELSLRQTR